MTPPPILPSSLAVGDEITWTSTQWRAKSYPVVRVFKRFARIDVSRDCPGWVATLDLRDRDAARLAIKIVRRGTT